MTDKKRLVTVYRKTLLEKMVKQNISIPQVCKDVHIEPIPNLELCIFNVLKGGNITSTMIPHRKSDRGPEFKDHRHSQCVAILRVSDTIAYPIAINQNSEISLIHETSTMQQVGRYLSEMTKRMVQIMPAGETGEESTI